MDTVVTAEISNFITRGRPFPKAINCLVVSSLVAASVVNRLFGLSLCRQSQTRPQSRHRPFPD